MNSYGEWQADTVLGLSTNYIYRGISLGDGKPTPQINTTLNHDSGFSLNLWLAKADIAGLRGDDSERRDIETEWSLGYSGELGNQWFFSTTAAWIEYIQDNQPVNNDYREFRIGLHYSDHTSILATYTDSLWNSGSTSYSAAVQRRFSGPLKTLGEAELGLMSISSNETINYPFLRFSLGIPISDHWNINLAYHFAGQESRNFFNSDRVGSQFSLAINRYLPLF